MNNEIVQNEKAAQTGTTFSNACVNSMKNAAGNQEKTKYRVDVVANFVQIDFPPREWLLYPFIQEKGIAMISAGTGIGKTYFALTIALAISQGKSFLKFKAEKPHKVLYIDGEMAAEEMQQRIKTLSVGLGIDPNTNNNLSIWTSDLQPDNIMPNLSKEDGQKQIEDYLQNNETNLLIIDNLSVLCNGIRENDAESWARFQDWLLVLRRQGYSVLEIQHNGKNGDYRGSSKQQDILNYTISLKRPEPYRKSEGARFEVHFGKTRGICGDVVRPFEARLQSTQNNDGLEWVMTDVSSEKLEKSQAEKEKAHELRAQGKTQQEIADTMHFSVGKVNKLLKN